jgi:hypothetical protein
MARKPLKRDTDISNRPGVRKQLLDVFADVEEGFADQHQRVDGLLDNWDLYNGVLSDKQFYNGNSKIFLPYIHDAVEARVTRFTNQIFPQSGRYVEAVGGEDSLPQATMALMESYVRRTKLKTEIIPGLIRNGDVEGQCSLYVSWVDEMRRVTRKEEVPDVTIGRADAQVEVPDLGTHIEYSDEEETVGRPDVEVISDADVLVLPVTAKSVDHAISIGGSVTIIRHWTKARIRKAMRDGDITQDAGDTLIKTMQKAAKGQYRSTSKRIADAAGIKDEGKEALIYETWTNLKVDGRDMLCMSFYGGDDNVLGAKRCPYWCDLVPLISCSVRKLAQLFKGKAPIDFVCDLQILANDTINEAADTAHFSAMPIVMTDPEKNPRVGSMVLGLAAVWETSPQDTQFAQFPELWATGMNRAMACQSQIFQTLGVNPAMVPQSSGVADTKRNQAEIANEQAVDLLTTADAVGVLEEGVLTPLIQRFAEYDYQFRDEDVTIKVYGELGVEAQMERVEPIQLNKRWEFSWLGVEQARNAAQLQQQIAGMNVLKSIPPQFYKGWEMNLIPVMTSMVNNLFGNRLGPQVFKKQMSITVDPEIENGMMEMGFNVDVHEADDDEKHLLEHNIALAKMNGVDPHGTFRAHITLHQAQMTAKAAAQQLQNAPAAGAPGSPGGAGPGAAGTPPGAQPGAPRPNGPPGMIHQDQMPAAGAAVMPRNM